MMLGVSSRLAQDYEVGMSLAAVYHRTVEVLYYCVI